MALPMVLVAVALTSIVAASVMSLISTMNVGQAQSKFQTQVGAFVEEVRGALGSKRACLNSMAGVSLTPSLDHQLDNIRDSGNSPGQILYQKGSRYGADTFELTSIRVANYRPDMALLGRITLHLKLRPLSSDVGLGEIDRSIEIRTEKDNSDKLANCIALAKMSDGLWTRSQEGQIDNIYYEGGFVGVGTPSPKLPIDAFGSAGIRSSNTGSGQAAIQIFQEGAPTDRKTWELISYDTSGDFAIRSVKDDYSLSEDVLRVRRKTAGHGIDHTLLTGGNVGIGTGYAPPEARLDVKNGYIHGRLECRVVVGPSGQAGSTAYCGPDEWVISGGGRCEVKGEGGLQDGFLHSSVPLSDGSGWVADCFRHDTLADVLVTAHAICCKR